MAKVDFYQLAGNTITAKNLFICKLIEKVYARKHQLYIHCSNQQQASELDELLWTYQDTSFVPHNILGEGPNEPPPVQFGYAEQTLKPRHKDVVINLADASNKLPNALLSYQRILEIIMNTPEQQALYQDRVNYYQVQNVPVNTHTIK